MIEHSNVDTCFTRNASALGSDKRLRKRALCAVHLPKNVLYPVPICNLLQNHPKMELICQLDVTSGRLDK